MASLGLTVSVPRSASPSPADQLGLELNEAVRRGDLVKASKLVAQGADVNFHDPTYGWMPLHNAAREGHFEIVKFLITGNADANGKDAISQTPLHRAAQHGFKQLVNYLLFVGCDPTSLDDFNQSAADLAKSSQHEELHRIIEKAIHKRERELAEEKKKYEKTMKLEKKKEKKLEKDRAMGKVPPLIRQRSFSVDEGLAEAKVVTISIQEPKKYHGMKRLSVVLDAFSKKDMDRLESHTKVGKIPKSQSIYDRGDIWIKYINGDQVQEEDEDE